MSKGRRKAQRPGRAPIPGLGAASSNPFDLVKRKAASVPLRPPKARRSKFVNSSAAETGLSYSLNRKAQKLQLYNLNAPLSLTHKNAPIEEHYEDYVSDHSEDDFRYSGDPRGLPQALEEHRLRRAFERQEKEQQRGLLSKLDAEFRELDLSQFMRPKRGSLSGSLAPATAHSTSAPTREPMRAASPKAADLYEENLRRLMAGPQESRAGGDLLKQLYAAGDLASKCEIARKFMSCNHVSPDGAEKCVVELARPLGELLQSASGHEGFCRCFDTMSAFVHYLCQRDSKDYHEYFLKFLRGVYVSFDHNVELSVEALVVLCFLLKVMEQGSALYKGGLIVLERLMDEHKVSAESFPRTRLLLAAAYSATLESGLYMPSFYKLCMRVCQGWRFVKRAVVESVLDMVSVCLRLLSSRECHVYPICLHIISPNISKLRFKSAKLASLKAIVAELIDVKLRPSVLDIYLRPKVDLQVPKYGQPTRLEPLREAALKHDKELYKSMKRGFLRTSIAAAKRRSVELQEKRVKSQERYRKVMRDAMMEQEMLRKEYTKPTSTAMLILRLYRRLSSSAHLHRFDKAALEQLQALHDTLECVDEIGSLAFDGTVLTAEFDAKRYIVINKHEASQQIWYSSFSGVDYFAKVGDKWLSARNGRDLDAAVSDDVLKATGQKIDIVRPSD